jgi:hypothetical protein
VTSSRLLVHFNFNYNYICHFSSFGTCFLFADRSIGQGDGQFCQENLSTEQFSCPTFIARGSPARRRRTSASSASRPSTTSLSA